MPGGRRVLAQLRRGNPAVQPRHHDVQRDHVGLDLGHLFQAIVPVHGCYHVKSLKREIDGDELPDDFVVIDNQHTAKSLGHGARLSALAQ